jgi:hypothetical protein
MAVAQDPPDGRDRSRLPFRVTRAQKVLAGATMFGVVVALLVAAPPLPWPLNLPQHLLGWIGLSVDPDPRARLLRLDTAYLLAVILQCNLFLLGAVWMWLVLAWRLARSPALFLCGMVMVGLAASIYLASSPTRTLVSWVAVAVLAITYLNYYRKGRFGYTRGAAAAVFAHIALICFFISLPIVLAIVLVDVLR